MRGGLAHISTRCYCTAPRHIHRRLQPIDAIPAIPLPEGAADKLAAFEALIRRWTPRVNLVSRRDVRRLRERHTLDSLSLLPWACGRLADVGAGAGFPGIPLAIARPDTTVVLVERSVRKSLFLRQAVIDLDLANVEVVATDIASYTPSALFDTVTVRAVAPPRTAWQLVGRLLAPEGRVLFQSRERLQSTMFENGAIREVAGAEPAWVTVVGLLEG